MIRSFSVIVQNTLSSQKPRLCLLSLPSSLFLLLSMEQSRDECIQRIYRWSIHECLVSVVGADPPWISIRTGTWPWWWVWCRCFCWALLPCCRWRTEVEASCTSCKTPEDCSQTPVWPPAGPTLPRSSCRESYCPGSIAEAERERPEMGWNPADCDVSVHQWRQIHLEDAGAVFKGIWVADIIHQADDVTGQIHIRQAVKVWEHFVELRRDATHFFIYFF